VHKQRAGLQQVTGRLGGQLAARRDAQSAIHVQAGAYARPRLRDRLVGDGLAGDPHFAERPVRIA
jgi:hypothetical protein